jgi:hypothetical protein
MARLRIYGGFRCALQAKERTHAIDAAEIQAKLSAMGWNEKQHKLKPYQLADLSTLLALRNGANFSVPGAGKTTVTFALHLLSRQQSDCILVAAPKNAFPAWESIIDECLLPTADVELRAPFQSLIGGEVRIEAMLGNGGKRFLISYDQLVRVDQVIGHYLGEIVDEFAVIGAQVKMRNRVGFTDLSVFCESFFKDVLNCLLDANLRNLNEERSNEPGLDLGDDENKLAVQVTSTANTEKVNATLAKITPEQKKAYRKIIVLSICGKQQKYSLDASLAAELNFSSKHVWDMNTLARKAVGLEIDKLESLHRLVRANVAKVRVELEVPDENGNYPTNGYDQWEVRIRPKIGDGWSFAKFSAEQGGVKLEEVDHADLEKGLKLLGKKLSRLPRVTREFLVVLLERRESKRSSRFGDTWSHLLYDKVVREFRGNDVDGELGILEHSKLVRIDGENPHDDGPAEIGVCLCFESDDLAINFLGFVEAKQLDLRRVIGEGDLSAF